MNIEQIKQIFKLKNWKSTIENDSQIMQYVVDITGFLPEDSPFYRRIWHIKNDVYEIPTCIVCHNPCFYRVRYIEYSKFCRVCARIDEQKNREMANEIKYGKKYTLSIPEVRDKIKQTNIQKYGVEHITSSPIIKDKIKQTIIEKYGVDNVSKLDNVKKLKIDKSIQVYGTNNVLSSPQIIEKIKQTNMERYGTPSPLSSDRIKQKIKETNKQKYGVEFHKQKNLTESAKKVLSSRDELIKLHHIEKLTHGEIGKLLGVAQTTVSNACAFHGVETKHYFKSAGEKQMSDFIKSLEPDCITNYRINGIELDCYIPSLQIAFEYNGIYWHSEKAGKTRNYHYNKFKKCQEYGIRLVSILETEWLEQNDLVRNKISVLLKKFSNRIFARKTIIKVVSNKDKKLFFDRHHIQGDGPSSINYGLYESGELVACMSFLNYKTHFVLNRFATSKLVVGGFTKLLKKFELDFDTPRIVTFADLRWSVGELYIKSGFKFDKLLSPDYAWVKHGKIRHKFNFRHSSGLKKLKNYDPSKSEIQNMKANGYYRLWDCGKIRFVKN